MVLVPYHLDFYIINRRNTLEKSDSHCSITCPFHHVTSPFREPCLVFTVQHGTVSSRLVSVVSSAALFSFSSPLRFEIKKFAMIVLLLDEEEEFTIERSGYTFMGIHTGLRKRKFACEY